MLLKLNVQLYKYAVIDYARSQIVYMIGLQKRWFISVSVTAAKQKLKEKIKIKHLKLVS